MDGLKVVVCPTEQKAEIAKQRMASDGFRVRNSDPTRYEGCAWDATAVGGTSEGQSNAWIVIGEL